jgi:5-(aminomethyl)-3-furanmethanol phosphate kinase
MSGEQTASSIVVKLGGSLADDPALAHWLHELRRSCCARFVAVPGGGPFADAVRDAQCRWCFSDDVAHTMALGAMDQFGRVLCAIELGSLPCTTVQQIEQAWARGRLPVWLPGQLMEQDQELARNWDVTSDTIAAWLADLLHAEGLLLVKSCDLPSEPGDPAQLATAGIVDRALPTYLSGRSIPLQVVHKNQWSELPRLVTRMQYQA